MKSLSRLLLMGVLSCAAMPSSLRAAETGVERVRAAVGKSMVLIQQSPLIFFKKAGCVSCHHQSLPAMAVGFARERGFAVDDKKARELNQTVATMMRARRETMLQAMTDGAGHHSIAYTLAGMAAQDLPADALTDAMTIHMAEGQMPDGYWSTAPDRPPVQYSDYTTTALGVWSLRKYAPEGRREEFEERVRRAMNWFTTAGSPVATEEAAFRLLGLGWAGAQASRTAEPTRDLLKRQRADGGWAQFPTLESDAYATGQALAALRLGGGLAPATRAYQRGLQYLLDTQREDGSWHVKSRARPFQPYFESGFPHGKDQWISICATSWATIALVLTEEPAGTEPGGKTAE